VGKSRKNGENPHKNRVLFQPDFKVRVYTSLIYVTENCLIEDAHAHTCTHAHMHTRRQADSAYAPHEGISIFSQRVGCTGTDICTESSIKRSFFENRKNARIQIIIRILHCYPLPSLVLHSIAALLDLHHTIHSSCSYNLLFAFTACNILYIYPYYFFCVVYYIHRSILYYLKMIILMRFFLIHLIIRE
jgi:hypothetical protein